MLANAQKGYLICCELSLRKWTQCEATSLTRSLKPLLEKLIHLCETGYVLIKVVVFIKCSFI